MKIEYYFDFYGDYEYEVDYDEEREALVWLIMRDFKDCLGSFLSKEYESGGKAMANYMVFRMDMIDNLEEYYKDDLKEYFWNDAEKECHICM